MAYFRFREKIMEPRKKFKVEMIVDCKPSLIEHLLEEICATAEYENARIQTYSSELITNEFKSKCD